MVDYTNARLNLVRQRDGKRFGGWVTWSSGVRAEAIIPEIGDIKPGEVVVGQFQGQKRKGDFVGRTACIDRQTLFIEFSRPLVEGLLDRDARIKVEAVQGKLQYDGRVYGFTATDMSSRGLGVLVPHPLRPGWVVQVAVPLDLEVFQFAAEVRHCRPEGTTEKHRAGLFMAKFSEAEQAKWKRCMASALQRG